MKKLLAVLMFWTMFITANTIETYTNSKFNFSIDYPSDILVNTTYESDDGINLSNKEKSLKFFVVVVHMASSMTANDVYHDELALVPNRASRIDEDVEISYKAQKENWYVLSGYNHTKKTIFYTKGFVYKKEKENLLIEYGFSYPIKEKKKYDKLIKIFNKSFDYRGDVEKNKIKLATEEER